MSSSTQVKKKQYDFGDLPEDVADKFRGTFKKPECRDCDFPLNEELASYKQSGTRWYMKCPLCGVVLAYRYNPRKK
ncbi:hypothetical protein KKA15_03020 [Patescibacteria group bacterium]|nr:hypothetical protein [Patescibacteria group bacterium]